MKVFASQKVHIKKYFANVNIEDRTSVFSHRLVPTFFTFPYTLENWKDYIKIGKDSILEIHYDLVPLILPHLF